MRPEVFNNAYGMPGDVGKELNEKKIHVVCTAQNGLTILNGMAMLFCKLERDLITKACDIVNEKRETGTLYPLANISILPKSEIKNPIIKDYPNLTYDELMSCIKDVFLANKNYIKSEIIVFYLDNYVNRRWAIEIVHEIVYSGFADDSFVARVYLT